MFIDCDSADGAIVFENILSKMKASEHAKDRIFFATTVDGTTLKQRTCVRNEKSVDVVVQYYCAYSKSTLLDNGQLNGSTRTVQKPRG